MLEKDVCKTKNNAAASRATASNIIFIVKESEKFYHKLSLVDMTLTLGYFVNTNKPFLT